MNPARCVAEFAAFLAAWCSKTLAYLDYRFAFASSARFRAQRFLVPTMIRFMPSLISGVACDHAGTIVVQV